MARSFMHMSPIHKEAIMGEITGDGTAVEIVDKTGFILGIDIALLGGVAALNAVDSQQ